MSADWKTKMDKKIRQLKWKYKILKIKWVLLFILPMLIIVFAYQVAKQYLKLRMHKLGAGIPINAETKSAVSTKTFSSEESL